MIYFYWTHNFLKTSHMNTVSLFTDMENKLREIIFGIVGSIIASFCVSLGVSTLTTHPWTIVVAGLIVGLAGSFANAFAPLIVSSRLVHTQSFSRNDFMQCVGSFLLTMIIVGLPLVPYILMNNLSVSRIISVMTGLVLLFIFGIYRAQLEEKSPLFHGFFLVFIGIASGYICYYIISLFK